jgi:nitroimidazol reductase NimA-like FMN-containing flavoprotein (pyridoxamine 5'-phosphate oxidase superfamily)
VSSPASARPLRRAEREITDPAELDAVLREAPVLYVAFHDEPAPYVVPLCFGHQDGVVYVHSAREGTKLDLLRANPLVGFSASTEMEVVPAGSPCAFSSRARSVAGTATAVIVEDEPERLRGLHAIMRHYAPGGTAALPEPAYKPGSLSRTCIIALRIRTLRGKRTG